MKQAPETEPHKLTTATEKFFVALGVLLIASATLFVIVGLAALAIGAMRWALS